MEECLHQMIGAVKHRCDELQHKSELLRGLLGPWPKKKLTPQEEKDQPVPIQTNPVQIESALTAVEQQALQQLDRLLLKAAKTRKVVPKWQQNEVEDHSSIEESVSLSQNESLKPKVLNETEDTKTLDSTNTRTLHKGLKSSVGQTKKPVVGKNVANFSSNIKSSTGSESLSSSARSQRSSDKRQVPEIKSQRSKIQSERPGSARASSRIGSAKSQGHVPAHMAAPFKTKPEPVKKGVLRKQTKSSAFAAGQKIQKSSGQPLNGTAYHTLPEIERKASDTDSLKHNRKTKIDSYESNINCESSTGQSEHGAAQATSSISEISQNVSKNLDETKHAAGTLRDFFSKGRDVHVSPQRVQQDQTSSVQHSASTESNTYQQHKTHNLKAVGPSLKIPTKLSKLVAVNSSLRHRTWDAMITKKVAATPNPGQTFVDRLTKSQAMPGPELHHRVEALKCLEEHTTLLAALNELNLELISETNSYEELLRTKATVEFILTKFAELEEKASYLSRIQFKELTDVRSSLDSKECWPSKWMQILSDDLQSFIVTRYKNSGQLKEQLASNTEWVDLCFSQCQLHMLLELTRQIEAECWPLLDDCNDPSILECVHSLLTTVGQFMPAFVENPE